MTGHSEQCVSDGVLSLEQYVSDCQQSKFEHVERTYTELDSRQVHWSKKTEMNLAGRTYQKWKIRGYIRKFITVFA